MKYSESVCPIPICYSILEIVDFTICNPQGEGAPPDEAHIDDIMKKGVFKVNWMQRGLQETTDLCDHPKIFLQVKDLLEDLMRFCHDNMSYVSSPSL